MSGNEVISTQVSPPPRPFSVVPPTRNCPSLSSTPPQTVDISWLLPRMGGAALARVLRVTGRPSPSHRRHPFVLVAIPSLSLSSTTSTLTSSSSLLLSSSPPSCSTSPSSLSPSPPSLSLASLSSLLPSPSTSSLVVAVLVVLLGC